MTAAATQEPKTAAAPRDPVVGELVYVRWPSERSQTWIECRVFKVENRMLYAKPTGQPIVGWLGENQVLKSFENQVGRGGYDTWDFKIPIVFRGMQPGAGEIRLFIETDPRRSDTENASGAHWVSAVQLSTYPIGSAPAPVVHIEYYSTRRDLLRGGSMLPIETMDRIAREWLLARGLLPKGQAEE